MSNYENILFDFDGTVCDISEGVFKGFDYVVDYYKLNIDKSIYKKMMGPPLRESFVNCLHLPESEIKNAIAKHREYYNAGGMYELEIYDGVVDLIKNLKQAGKKVYIATSKPEHYTVKILEKIGLKDLFDFVGGSDISESNRVEKIDVLKYVMKENNLTSENSIMIGDRFYDVRGAHAVGLKCIGILWGFGDLQEMQECGADYIKATPKDVEEFLLK